MSIKRDFPLIGSYLILTVILILYTFPLLYLLNTSFKTPAEFARNPISFAENVLNPRNFLTAFQRGNLIRYSINTIFYATGSAVITLLVCMLAAFPISRKYVKGSIIWFNVFIACMFLPNGLIPQFRLMVFLGLYNTFYGYILLKVSTGIVFFLFTSYIKSIPIEFDEAAGIDGCGYMNYVIRILLPLMRPALASGFILHVVGVWNDIIGGVLYFSDKRLYPAVRGLFAFYGQYGNDWPPLSAAVIIIALPLILLYIFFQRYIIDGAVAGAFKG